MAGSVNKACKMCGIIFARASKLSDSQWSRKKFCSRKCAATKRKIPLSEMAGLYESGLSSREVSDLAGVSAHAVRIALKSYGVSLRGLSDAMKLSHNKPGMSEMFSKAATGRRHTDETKEKLSSVFGVNHPLWRGGVTLSAQGYLQFTASPENGDNAGRLVHQVICEQKEGRKIKDGFHVHHIDGNKLNNDPENLQSMPASDHARLHMKERLSKNA